MNRGENSDSIPIDLILDILSRLPAKSISRFLCVSKLWWSMLSRPYFTRSFLTRSSARPRMLFVLVQAEDGCEWSFFSSTQPQNPYGKSPLVVSADFHMKFRVELHQDDIRYASGLIYFPSMVISEEDECSDHVICNPITGQYVILPKQSCDKRSYSFLGFDPIENQFMVLFMAYRYCDDGHRILTLGTGKLWWRKIQCPLKHKPFRLCDGICINGVLYYLAETIRDTSCVIVCFDIRYEKFNFIDAKWFGGDTTLINYKGKLGGIDYKYDHSGGWFKIDQFHVWILEDVKKQEWSKYVYTTPENQVIDLNEVSVVGMTATGDIVLANNNTCKPFYVYYFNPEKNTFRSFEIQGFGANLETHENRGADCAVIAFLDHVENLNVNDAKHFKSSRINQGLNIIRKRPKPQQQPPQRRHTSRDLCNNSAPSAKNKQTTILLQNKYDLLANLE